MSFRLALMLGAMAALGGCNTMNQNIASEDPAFGESVRYNAAIQTINPDPVYPPGGAMPGDSGAKFGKFDAVIEHHRRGWRRAGKCSREHFRQD